MGDEEKNDDYQKKMKEIEETVDFGETGGKEETEEMLEEEIPGEENQEGPAEEINEDIPERVVEESVLEAPDRNDQKTNKKSGKTIKIVAIICAAVLVLGIAGFFGYRAWEADSMTYAMTFNGERVGIETYKFFVLLQQSPEGAIDNAISQIQESLVIRKAAKDKGVALTDEEHDQLLADAQEMKTAITDYGYRMPDVPDEELVQIMSVSQCAEKMMDIFAVEDFDQAAYDTAFEEYKNQPQNYVNVDMHYVITDNAESAEEAREAVLDGVEIEKVLEEYSLAYAEAGAETITLQDAQLEQTQNEEIVSLEEGKPSSVFDLNGNFVVFIPYYKSTPPDEEIEAGFKEKYLYDFGLETFTARLEEWKNTAKFVINQKAVDSVDIDEVNRIITPETDGAADVPTENPENQ